MNTMQTEGTFKNSSQWSDHVVLTVDVEDYFMSPECIAFESWNSFEPAIHKGMERVLALLDEYQAKATFFFVGWLAERYPELVQWTVEKGHEIASHTYDHTFVSELNAEQFDQSLCKSLEILRQLAPNQPVHGHRAPAFSLDASQPWQFEILRKNGIVYDSSINPRSTYLYGDSMANRHPSTIHGIVEMPPGAVKFGGMRMPVGGGGTLRILPQWYLKWARSRYQAEGFPPVIHIHPWEFVPDQPKIKLPALLHLIHWIGIKSTVLKMRKILEENKILTMSQYYSGLTGNISDSENLHYNDLL